MFGLGKEKKPQGLTINSLVQETIVEGNIHSETDIRIDGTLHGNLHCKAKVVIGQSGYVRGDIVCKTALIAGKLDGNLSVAERLDLQETAKIIGDIASLKLVIADGASFNGNCQMGKQPTESPTTHAPKK